MSDDQKDAVLGWREDIALKAARLAAALDARKQLLTLSDRKWPSIAGKVIQLPASGDRGWDAVDEALAENIDIWTWGSRSCNR